MTRRPRRNHGPVFKPKVAVAAIKGEKTLVELAQQFDVHPNQIAQWRTQLLDGASGVFGEAAKAEAAPAVCQPALKRDPLVEHLLAAYLHAGLLVDDIPDRIQFADTLRRCREREVISDADRRTTCSATTRSFRSALR